MNINATAVIINASIDLVNHPGTNFITAQWGASDGSTQLSSQADAFVSYASNQKDHDIRVVIAAAILNASQQLWVIAPGDIFIPFSNNL
jgi:hypothetical protein